MPFEQPGRVANVLTVWIADLFPYTGKTGNLERNKSFTAPRKNRGNGQVTLPLSARGRRTIAIWRTPGRFDGLFARPVLCGIATDIHLCQLQPPPVG